MIFRIMDNRKEIEEIERIISNELDTNDLVKFALLYKKLKTRDDKNGLMRLVEDYCSRPLW